MNSSTRTFSRRLREPAAALASLEGSAERRLFLGMYLLAPLAFLLMQLPLMWLNRIVVRLARPSGTPLRMSPDRAAHVVALAQDSGHPLVRRGCLTRGLSLLWVLRRHGIDVQLAFGIGGAPDEYQGHCWLIRDGEPFLEKEAFGERFVEVFRIPAVAGT